MVDATPCMMYDMCYTKYNNCPKYKNKLSKLEIKLHTWLLGI